MKVTIHLRLTKKWCVVLYLCASYMLSCLRQGKPYLYLYFQIIYTEQHVTDAECTREGTNFFVRVWEPLSRDYHVNVAVRRCGRFPAVWTSVVGDSGSNHSHSGIISLTGPTPNWYIPRHCSVADGEFEKRTRQREFMNLLSMISQYLTTSIGTCFVLTINGLIDGYRRFGRN